jgi:isopentenyl-diphosphate Delta-isomerase
MIYGLEKIMENKYVIVNDQDEVIGYKTKVEIGSQDIHRASAVWVTNSQGDILLGKRAKNKRWDPDKWGMAVSGTLEEGESYYSNAVKELEEELGLKKVKLKEGPKGRASKSDNNYFYQIYLLTFDGNINDLEFDREEIQELRWFSKVDLMKKIKNNPDDFSTSAKLATKLAHTSYSQT